MQLVGLVCIVAIGACNACSWEDIGVGPIQYP